MIQQIGFKWQRKRLARQILRSQRAWHQPVLQMAQRLHDHVCISHVTVLVILQQTRRAARCLACVNVVRPIANHQQPIHVMQAAQGGNVQQTVCGWGLDRPGKSREIRKFGGKNFSSANFLRVHSRASWLLRVRMASGTSRACSACSKS